MSFGHFKIYNESCFETFEKLKNRRQVDLVITSPPYNTNRKAGKTRNLLTVSETSENQCKWALERVRKAVNGKSEI